MGASSLTRMLDASGERWPQRALHFHSTRERIDFGELAERSRRFAGGLRARGVQRGDRVALALPTCRDFLVALFGILRAGAVAVPMPVRTGLQDARRYLQRFRRVVDDAGVRHVVRPESPYDVLAAASLGGARISSPGSVLGEGASPVDGDAGSADLALVQFTSGSTAAPKGVALTHDNLLAAIRSICHGARVTPDDVNGQWLPLHHDMGLIGLIAGIAGGVAHNIWRPTAFLKNPAAWLAEFCGVRATVYAGPNFSYKQILASVDDKALDRLDLSALRVAFNGAEPVDPRVMELFASRFAPAGLRPNVLFPVYGLAEATLPVAFPELGEPTHTTWVDRDLLAREGHARCVPRSDRGARGVVAVGRAVLDHEVRVVGEQGKPLGDGMTGEIVVRGPSIMKGYYGNREATTDALRNGWLHTGDIGFLLEGQLHVTGRLKEMMIVHGANVYPTDVEALLEELPDVEPRGCVAFDIGPPEAGRVAAVVATRLSDPERLEQLASRAHASLSLEFGLVDVEVYLVKPCTIPLTTSGKPQRLLLRQRLEAGDLHKGTRLAKVSVAPHEKSHEQLPNIS